MDFTADTPLTGAPTADPGGAAPPTADPGGAAPPTMPTATGGEERGALRRVLALLRGVAASLEQ
eukprot:gene8537-435_t